MKEKAPERIEGKRLCELCNAPLSMYNKTKQCFNHKVDKDARSEEFLEARSPSTSLADSRSRGRWSSYNELDR